MHTRHTSSNSLRTSTLENKIPDNEPGTQAHGSPEDCLRGAPPLRGALEFLVAPTDVCLRRCRVGDELADVFFLRGQVGDEGLLQGGDLEEGFFGVSCGDVRFFFFLTSKTPNRDGKESVRHTGPCSAYPHSASA